MARRTDFQVIEVSGWYDVQRRGRAVAYDLNSMETARRVMRRRGAQPGEEFEVLDANGNLIRKEKV